MRSQALKVKQTIADERSGALMKILYFAWLKSKVGIGEEAVTPPAEVATVGALLDWLSTRGPKHAAALANRSIVRVAVNQEYAGLDHPVKTGDEVALFPPVTGG
jgi:molybdopterin synthase sulfur carrier subunit